MKVLLQNKLYKIISLNALSVGVNLVLGLASTKIISVFLGTSGMAFIGSMRNFSTMLRSLGTLGINNAIIRLFVEHRADRHELQKIYATFFWLFLIISVAIGLPVFFAGDAISELLFSNANYGMPIRFFALIVPFIALNTFWMAVFNGLEQFRNIIAIQIVSNCVAFGVTAILIWRYGLAGGLYALAVAEMIALIVTFLFTRRHAEYFTFRLKLGVSKKYLAVIQNFSAMALLSAVIVPLSLIIIRRMLIETHSLDEAGIWDSVNRLSGFYMSVFNSGLALYYMPKLASLNTDAEFKSELGTYFKTLVPLFMIMAVGVYLLRYFIIDLAFTSDFAESATVLQWQILGDCLRIMSLAFGFQIVVKTMMKEFFIIETLHNVIFVGTASLLIPENSYEGALQAYLFANVCTLIMLLFVFRKIFK